MYIVVTFFTTFFGDFAENRPPASQMTIYPYTAGRAKIGFFDACMGMWKTCRFSVDNSSLNLWITTAGRVLDPFPPGCLRCCRSDHGQGVRRGSPVFRAELINGRRADPDQGGTAEHGRGFDHGSTARAGAGSPGPVGLWRLLIMAGGSRSGFNGWSRAAGGRGRFYPFAYWVNRRRTKSPRWGDALTA